jgi:DnaB helicase-like protein/AAA domain-containing protein
VSAPPTPQNLAAEESVLGAILLAGASGVEASAKTLAAVEGTGLRAEDFYRASHGQMFAAAQRVAARGQPTDVLVLADGLRDRLGEIGGEDRLLELAALVPATSNAGHYARLVVEAAERRRQAALARAVLAATENGAVDSALLDQLVRSVERQRAGAAREHTWKPLDVIGLGSEEPKPPQIGGLLYPGKRHVISGEDDAGKTMLLLGISADELREGRGVVWIDTDDMGAASVLERLRLFGADEEAIRSLFAYLHPEEALSDAARDDVIALLRERDVRLMVNDAFNAALTLHGYSPGSTEEVEAFWQRAVAPFCHAGAAVVLPDHVVKRKDERGRYAYGSERKATGCDLHLGLRVIEPFGRGRRGKARITVHRDRIGFLPRPSPGLFVLDSDADTGRLAWRLEASREKGEQGEQDWRPTGYMEKVSRYLELRRADPPSITQIEEGVPGGTDYKRQAVEALIRDGYAIEIPGSRNARLIQSVRPFREADEWQESEAES